MERIIGGVLLAIGICFGIWILKKGVEKRALVREEKGAWPVIAAGEAVIYFLATMGISDFLLNTLFIRFFKLTDDRRLPPTLVSTCLTPGTIVAFSLLRSENSIDAVSLLVCCLCAVAGSFAGSRVVGGLDGARIKKVMAFALSVCLMVLAIRTFFTAEGMWTLTGLPPVKLIIAALFTFLWGFLNMFGIPFKPSGMAVFLLLGLSPLAALTFTLVVGGIAPLAGGIEVVRRQEYHKKMACCAVVSGTAGVIAGTVVAVSISAVALNIIMMIVLLIAIVSMLR